MSNTDLETNLWLPNGERGWKRGKLRVWGYQTQTIVYKTDKQRGPII